MAVLERRITIRQNRVSLEPTPVKWAKLHVPESTKEKYHKHCRTTWWSSWPTRNVIWNRTNSNTSLQMRDRESKRPSSRSNSTSWSSSGIIALRKTSNSSLNGFHMLNSKSIENQNLKRSESSSWRKTATRKSLRVTKINRKVISCWTVSSLWIRTSSRLTKTAVAKKWESPALMQPPPPRSRKKQTPSRTFKLWTLQDCSRRTSCLRMLSVCSSKN